MRRSSRRSIPGFHRLFLRLLIRSRRLGWLARGGGGVVLHRRTAAAFSGNAVAIDGHPIEILVLFEKIGHVEERVPFQTQVDKSRLHAGQDPRHAAFVNAARERIFIGSLEKHFHQLVVFQNGHFGLVAIRRDHQFFAHENSSSSWRERWITETEGGQSIHRVIQRTVSRCDDKIFWPLESGDSSQTPSKALETARPGRGRPWQIG